MAETTFLRCLMLAVFGYLNFAYAGTVTVSDGGYGNVVVAIGERVPEDVNLLQRIKDDFTAASSFLFEATQHRLYFSNITILVPRSWTTFTAPDVIQSERFETSDIIIDDSQEDRPNRPFTNKDSGCGQPGRYIHFTPTFIMDENEANKYGGYGKVIAHEWAHYRWGVFDEYPRPGASDFYAASNGYYEATRCTRAISGQVVSTLDGKDAECNPKNGEPPNHCRFVDDTTGSYKASILYKQFLPKIDQFCDQNDDSTIKHNREAPNLQNIHCFGKSTWQVMREHSDLNTQINQLPANTDTTPTFREVKPIANNWVLVLDSSGSMKGERLRQLRQAASNFINTAVQIGESLSIVSFKGDTELNSPLTTILSQSTRDNLIATLPTEAGGISNIGAGIQLGRAQLANSGIYGGRMLVITDGIETAQPFIKDVIHLLTPFSITVDTIAIGPQTTPNLELLTRKTGGQSFYHSDSSTTLDEAFKAFSERNRGASDALITVFTKYLILEPSQTDTSMVIIDSSIGDDTQFLFDYSQGEASVEGILTRPGGSTITKTNTTEYFEDSSFSLTRITIDGTAETGTWSLVLDNTSQERQNVTIIVQSRARKNSGGSEVDPIRATATWGKESVSIMSDTVATNNQTLFVAVSKGYVPVLNADVRATVSTPAGNLQPFSIKDDGLGADIQKNDGIYSGFLTEFKGKGRYGLSVMVENPKNTAMLSPASVLGQGAVINPDDELIRQETPAGPFQRVVNGGSFTCEGMLCSGTVDVFPPARILDLKAKVLDLMKSDVTLTYTAPGDDLMTGIVHTYEIRKSLSDIDILYDDFESAEEETTIVTSEEAGTQESYTVRNLTPGPHSYFFAIVAIDDFGHRSLVSNIASASMRFVEIGVTWTEPPTTSTESVLTIKSGTSSKVSADITAALGSTSTEMSTTKVTVNGITLLAIIIAIAAPLLAILIAIAALAFCLLCKKRKRRSEDKEKQTEQNGNAMPIYGNLPENGNAMPVYGNLPETFAGAVPESSMETTRTAELVSNAGHTEQPPEEEVNPLESKVDVEQNTYSELPEKRSNGYANGHMPGTSGLRRDGTYVDYDPRRRDSSSSSEDEIAREKRRIREELHEMQEYY